MKNDRLEFIGTIAAVFAITFALTASFIWIWHLIFKGSIG
jgi:hypothetical protein